MYRPIHFNKDVLWGTNGICINMSDKESCFENNEVIKYCRAWPKDASTNCFIEMWKCLPGRKVTNCTMKKVSSLRFV